MHAGRERKIGVSIFKAEAIHAVEMPSLLPVVGSAASRSAAHTDPYHLFIALATSSCHSKAPSRPEGKKKKTNDRFDGNDGKALDKKESDNTTMTLFID